MTNRSGSEPSWASPAGACQVIPYIEGDGVGHDIWPAAQLVFDAALHKHGKQVTWLPLVAGEQAFRKTGHWLPDETLQAFSRHLVGIKGPLATPIAMGERSVNVSLRRMLDLYVCLRPVRWIPGVPSPVTHPEAVDMVIFRENTEDVYAGFELQAGSREARSLIVEMRTRFAWDIRADSGIGIKPVSEFASKRLMRAAIEYALRHRRRSVTMVHKGNIQKYTEGAFRDWGYDVVREEYADFAVAASDCGGDAGDKLLVKDRIADNMLQQILSDPADFDVVATTNLNGDYLSDALAAQVGGLGIAAGANINFETGRAIFEAVHGTAPDLEGKDLANPSSLLLSGVMMFQHVGWHKVAHDITSALEATIRDRVVTSDLGRLMPDAKQVSCSTFGREVADRL
jgi:isocitrate dehydrogenase